VATKRRDPDPEGLLRELTAGSGAYTEMDRYREFRSVFLDTEAGRRVLHQILAWGHIWTTSMSQTPHEMAFSEGERNLGLKILAAVEVEPPTRPTRAATRKQ
jgi:hypothetical protein